MRSAPAPLGSEPGGDLDAVIVAEAISKRYPGRPVMIFPPVVSIFDRDLSLFRGRRTPDEEVKLEPAAFGYGPAEFDLDDGDDDDLDDGDEDELEPERPRPAAQPRARPNEMFWALRDISLRVAPGGAIGIAGGPGAGKSTLLRILAGRAFPTEGRVVAHGKIAPLAADAQKALGLSGKLRGPDVVLAARLLGVEGQVAKEHRQEIEELAAPLVTPDGDPVPGAVKKLAVAITVVMPADAILLDDLRGLDADFVTRVHERLRERRRAGCALVLAARDASAIAPLCDDVIALEEGVVGGPGESGEAGAPPAAVTLSVEVKTARGRRSKRFDAREELLVEVRVEAAEGDTQVRCGVVFTPRDGGPGFRAELPEPLRVERSRAHLLVARVPAGTLPVAAYDVSAEVTAPENSSGAIARATPRIRIEGEPDAQRDGRAPGPIPAEWSLSDEAR